MKQHYAAAKQCKENVRQMGMKRLQDLNAASKQCKENETKAPAPAENLLLSWSSSIHKVKNGSAVVGGAGN
jgi:hypothetical protein